eukprot:SAG31_NODE_18857_length_620_cov_0.986564_1_plen_22_part_01
MASSRVGASTNPRGAGQPVAGS